ncbi:MAG: DNA recombination protein RmuC [Prevotella sp.]|nr:DNA recombination protein RmuC [Prevotella sp.]
MEFVYILIGVVVGGLIAFLFVNQKKKGVESTLMLTSQRLGQEEQQRQTLLEEHDALKTEMQELQERLTNLRLQLATSETQLESLSVQREKEVAMLREQNEAEKQAIREQMSQESQQRQTQFAEQMQSSREDFDRQQQSLREQFQEQLRTVQEQFKNLAATVLDQTSDKLKTQNTESMQTLTAPLQQNLEQLQQAIRNTNSETAKQTASLSEQLKAMGEQTSRITETATRLTNVMRGGNKIQGNWGEMTLKNLLESQGLQLGRDFDLQNTLVDEQGNALINEDSGSKMVPDAILHYPNNEDVIIDAKMSIDAYAKYMETEDENQRKVLAKEVVRSIREQFKRLSSKEYSRYVKAPRKSVDFVIMYVPYEGALQLALATDPGLWNEAFNKKIFITGQQNLMAILTMIHAAWRQYMQNENEKQVYVLAEELLRRVGAFIREFGALKEHLRLASDDVQQLEQKYDGRRGIVQKANQLKKLGVKENIKYPIPADEEDEETTGEKELEDKTQAEDTES